MSDHDSAVALFDEVYAANAHTHGGGAHNDLTVQLFELATLTQRLIQDVEACGFQLRSIETGDPEKNDFVALILFEEDA